jgi:predicted O-methyltransferase YrrM
MTRTAHDLVDWQGYLYHPEVDCLHRLAERTASWGKIHPVFVNIGAGAGTSTFALLEGNPNAIVFSVDIRADEHPEYTNEHLRLKEELEAGCEFPKHVIRIWGDSRIIGKAWPYKVDLIFVDGGHDYAEVVSDIEAWADKVVEGGIIAFHDYGLKLTDNSEQWPGVRQAVNEWVSKANPRLIENVAMIRAYEV